VDLGLLFILRLQDHTNLDTQHSVGRHWASVQPDAETSTWQHTRNRHSCSRQDSNLQSQQTSEHRPTPYTNNTLTNIYLLAKVSFFFYK